MPRGPVVATPVPGAVPQNPGDVIQSSVWNATVNDIYNILNTIQPMEYGGSNASTPIGAFDNFHTASASIASATITDLSTASGYYVEITGTTNITGFGTETAGVLRALRFSGILTITYSATSLILPGAANITTAAGDTALFVSEGGGNWRCIGYDKASGQAVISSLPTVKGHIYGLTLSTNITDAANDIDIAVGEAASDAATPTLITLATPLVKRLDASWAVGTNQGMLDTGAVANSTYYLWLIQRSDTSVVDVIASLSATTPTMPTNYDRKRAIGEVTRTAGVNANPRWYGPAISQAQNVNQGLAKCWGVVTYSGSTPTLGASYNVANISVGGTGIVTINVATDFASANYAPMVTSLMGSANLDVNVGTKGAGSFIVYGRNSNNGAQADVDFSFVAYGDQ